MSLEVSGKLAVKYDTQQVKESFKKREFVLEMSEEINGNIYTNFAKFQLVQTKCDLLDRFNEGDMVKVNFNLKGNRWEKDGKVNYITNLDAWRIETVAAANNNVPNAAPGYGSIGNSNTGNNAPVYNPSPESGDDLPF